MSKTVLIIASEFPPGPGGIGNHAFNLANSLTQKGESVSVSTPSNKPYRDKESEFDKQQPFNVIRYHKSKWKLITYWKLLTVFKNEIAKNPDIQFIVSGMVPLILGGLLRTFFNVKCRMTVVVHGLDINSSDPILSRMVRSALNKYDHIIAVSNFTAGKLPQSVNHKVKVINNGVDPERLQALYVREETVDRLAGVPSLVTVGTIWERKGQINVVKAMPEILKQFPNAHYHMIGLPNDVQPVMETALKLNVNNHITIHGAVSDRKLVKALAGADVFMMLSVDTKNGDFEGFGIAILEANYFGVPAIGSAHSGIEDAIQNGETGLLVNPHHPVQIADAITNIVNNRIIFSEKAKQFSISHSWKNVIEKYLQVIKN